MHAGDAGALQDDFCGFDVSEYDGDCFVAVDFAAYGAVVVAFEREEAHNPDHRLLLHYNILYRHCEAQGSQESLGRSVDFWDRSFDLARSLDFLSFFHDDCVYFCCVCRCVCLGFWHVL